MMQLILEDSRQQEKKHEVKHEYFRKNGIHWNRTALYCGDYTLPADQRVCIDTKKDIQELIGDIQVKQMSKTAIKQAVFDIAEENHIGFDLAEQIYHAICDDDAERFAEKEINDICFQNGVPERAISGFQMLYVKRHGFFHRGLKRAQNSGIRLIILVDNREGVEAIDDLFHWRNPRLDIWVNSKEVIGTWKNGRPRYKRVQKYPNAVTGERLSKACLTMQLKYGVEFQFCQPEDAGRIILELLGVDACAKC
mgnify:CR=1 FL=1